MMLEKNFTPAADGFHMPGEYEPHDGCIIVWPQRPGSWSFGAVAACEAFTAVIKAIAASEKVYVICGAKHFAVAQEYLAGIANVELVAMETDDSWARDIGPTFVVCDGAQGRELRGVNWRFNAWGGDVDGLYPDYEQDDAFAEKFAEYYGAALYDAVPFVLEGGSIHCDGEGTALVTEACLLSAGRNPDLSKEQIEQKLKTYLGVEKVLWIPRGIYNDETNEHVDNVCAFIRPGEVVLAWTEDENDPQYAERENLVEWEDQIFGEMKGIGITNRFKNNPSQIVASAPCFGEHNREVLQEFGYTDKEIDDLYKKGEIVTWTPADTARIKNFVEWHFFWDPERQAKRIGLEYPPKK